MISTVVFDLAEVYLKGLLGVEHRLERMLGKPAKEIYPLLHGPELAALFRGQITEEEYWSRVIRKNRWSTGTKQLKAAVRENFREIDGVRQVIEKLKKKGLRLGLLSVHTREWVVYCEKRFDYHRLFDSVLYSFEMGVLKPDKRAYRMILERLDARPEECVFIDDSAANIKAAKELGLNTICFRSAQQLEKELAYFSINIR